MARRARETNKNSKLRIFQIGVGGIGALQRKGLKDHPMVEFAGFCDVDRHGAGQDHRRNIPAPGRSPITARPSPTALDQFDAVIVDMPDFHHTPMMLTAMKHHKHIYGQKPLVQQLDELRMVREGLAARPELVTQMGNQRACKEGRMQAVEILRSNQLGRPVEAWVWTGSVERGTYFVEPWSEYTPAKPMPEYTELGSLAWAARRRTALQRGPRAAALAGVLGDRRRATRGLGLPPS